MIIHVCPPFCLQVRGKGHWGKWEGMEKMFNLRSKAGAYIQSPVNYNRVQEVLSSVPSSDEVMVKDTTKSHNTGFSGARPPPPPWQNRAPVGLS